MMERNGILFYSKNDSGYFHTYNFSKLIVNVLDLAESLIIPSRLVVSGLTHSEAMSEFGKMLGMAVPLAYMPAVITSSLSTTVLPAVSEAAALKSGIQ